jgi:type I restriction enzyme M protein
MREQSPHDLTRALSSLNDALRAALPHNQSNALIRETLAALLLLRWIDYAEIEQEAMAVFEVRQHQPLVPRALQWRGWALLQQPNDIAQRLREVVRWLEDSRADRQHPLSAWLQRLASPLRRTLEVVDFVYMHDLVHWVGELPFETPGERRTLLEVFDRVLAETNDGSDGQYSTPTNIAHLVAALANPQPGERIYDPCFGFGNFLAAAWQRAERSRRDVRRPESLLDIAGVEINASAFIVGLTRMLLAGIETPHLELGNSLERDAPNSPIRQGFDVVLANPPIGAKTARDSLGHQHFAFLTSDSVGLFIQHALAQLKPRGRAIIAVPEGFLFRGGAERDLRRYLLEQGQIEAVVGLPAGAFAPYTGIKGSLLLLNRQGGLSRVRMVDASPMFETRSGRKPPAIRSEIAQQLAAEVRRPELRRLGETHPGVLEGAPGTGVLSRAVWEVSVEELAAAEWDLTPRRREKGELDELLANVRDALGESGPAVPLSSVARVTAGRSIKSVDLLAEPVSERAMGYIRIRDLNQGKVGNPSSWVRPDLAALERSFALLPGDVLVSKSGTIGKAAIVRNGAVGSLAANGLYVLRVDQDRLDAGFLLSYFASPACQKWLAARSRGAVIQHLNRVVLDELPVPLPPLSLQATAAAQFREFGTDALAFLTQATGRGESDRLTAWLAEMSATIPSIAVGVDKTPALSLFEPLVEMGATAQRWLEQEQISSQFARWLRPLSNSLLHLSGVAQIPAGPSLLSVLHDAERSVQVVLEHATGHLPAETSARTIGERLRDWLRAAIADLAYGAGIRVRAAPSSLPAGGFAEFAIDLENEGPLPLRSLRVETSPDWGNAQISFLAERASLSLPLRGDVPKHGNQLELLLIWQARTLTGQLVSGEVQWAVRVAEANVSASVRSAELGGSPYVTGSPLEPRHGHNVFYGREELIRQVSRQIAAQGNVVLLEGNRRAGKTSILKHLEGRTAIPAWLAVYSSLQGAEGAAQTVGIPTAEVFRELGRSVAAALIKLGVDVPLPNGQIVASGKAALGVARACRDGISETSPFADFHEYLQLVLSVLEPLGLGLVLMLDEFDKLQEGIDNGVTSPQVPENIRFLIQTYPKFSAILTGSRRLKRLREEYWSALYGLGTNIPVTALDTESARNVVTQPVRDRLTFSNEAVDRVIEVTARQPYLMQCLCNRVFDYAVQTKVRSITLSIVNEAALGLVRDNEHFANLWDFAARGPQTGRQRRQMILLICAMSFKQRTHVSFGTLQEQLVQTGVEVDEEALDADLGYLRELELIEFSGEIGDGQYRLAIPLMADWIEQQQDADVVTGRARAEAEEEGAGS